MAPEDAQLLTIVNAFHSKMDTGFARLHDRLDVQKTAISNLKEEQGNHTQKLDHVVSQHITNHPPATTCPNVAKLDRHLQEHPPHAPLNDLIKEREEDHEDKREVVKNIAAWSFRGIVFAILVKLGLEQYWPGG